MTWHTAFGLFLMTAATSAGDVLTIEAVDEAGSPVVAAEAYLIEGGNDTPATARWVASEQGVIHIDSDDLKAPVEGSARVVVRAPGRAWAMAPVTLPHEGTLRLEIPRGREVELVLDGAPVDLTPFVFVRGQSVAAWLANVQWRQTRIEDPAAAFSAGLVTRAGEGHYRMRVPDDVTDLYVLVDHAGFLRAHQTGPMTPGDDPLSIDLPAPVSMAINVAAEEGQPAAYDTCGAIVSTSPNIPDGGWTFKVARQFVEDQSLTWTVTDLAPRFYTLSAYTGTSDTWHDRSRDDYYEARGVLDLTAQAHGEVDIELRTFDEAATRARIAEAPGTTLHLVGATGSAPVGASYAVSVRVQGFDKTITLAEGAVPEDGRIEIEHLPGYDIGRVSLDVDGRRVASLDQSEHGTMTIHLPPQPGEPAPDFEMLDILTDKTLRVSDYRGQALLLEFWASWCGPCQAPMSHNNDLMAEYAAAWKGKAAILGVSVDREIETIQDHVNTRGWTNVRQAWVDDAWDSDAAKRYAVRGVPSAFLIDPKGIVVWAGHPNDLDVKARLEELMVR